MLLSLRPRMKAARDLARCNGLKSKEARDS